MSSVEGEFNGIAGGCFADVLHSTQNYHQEHATEPRRLPKDVLAALGAVILRFPSVTLPALEPQILHLWSMFCISTYWTVARVA
jgi:hypothetical protein